MMQTKLCSTTCPYCGVGCGVDVERIVEPNGDVSLANLIGQREHPANYGRLCVKGSHLLDTNDTNGRMAYPSVNGQRVEWPAAINAVASAMSQAIAEHGPDSVAMYVSGQLLTEDYYVANKLMKGFVGTANIDTNSRLCMSSAVAAYKRSFGSDSVPCNYEDIESTDLFVMVGSNAAWTHPVLFQRVEKAKQRNPNMRIICVDPRETASCALADQHLALRPGSDAVLFNGLLAFLAANNGLDKSFIEQSTEGFTAVLVNASEFTIERVANECDLSQASVTAFFQQFLSSKTAITFYSMGINQSSSGVDKANAIINCHLASGKIGKVGSGPFSITGQPNAMGGREVGGLANMLAAHMDIENTEHRKIVGEYWQSPNLVTSGGLKAVDMFDAVASGQIKFIWIMATNPLVSMPNRNAIENALRKCPTVVVSDTVASNDTLRFAHIKLPATGWSEKDGTVTNSERRISRQHGLLAPFAESRHDWQAICAVAQAMGFSDAFAFQSPREIFNEHAGLTAYRNNGSRDLDLSGLQDLTEEQYENFKPIQWPVNKANPDGTARLFGDGVFFTPSKRANFISVVPRQPEQQTSEDFPLVLNTGRLRDQWHTMTRTGKALKLTQHFNESFVSMHPQDANKSGIKDGQIVALTSRVNTTKPVFLRAKLDGSQRQGECFAPIHWSMENTSTSSVARLFSSAHDSVSGQPELKHAAINIEIATVNSYADVYTTAKLPSTWLNDIDYWSFTPFENGYVYRLGSEMSTDELASQLHPLLTSEVELIQRVTNSQSNLIALVNERIVLAAFVTTDILASNSAWLADCFTRGSLDSASITALIRGEVPNEYTQGRLICSCYKVREKSIEAAIEQGCSTVAELGEKLSCGTNCGSCKSELAGMLHNHNETKRNRHGEEIISVVMRSSESPAFSESSQEALK